MCVLTEKYKGKKVTGYKVAYKDENDRYFSIATGVEYVTGPVPKPDTQKRIGKFFVTSLLNGWFYKSDFFGKTAIFENKVIAENLLNYILLTDSNPALTRLTDGTILAEDPSLDEVMYTKEHLIILEMTISENLWRGKYLGASTEPVVAGEFIKSIKEVINEH